MRAKTIAISTIVLTILLVAGVSMAWFMDNEAIANEFRMGTVIVEVEENGFDDIQDATVRSYDKNVQVRSLGTKRTYVRVRLVPEWSNPSLPVTNVGLNMANNSDWLLHSDGYYYFKYYLTTNQLTSMLLESVIFTGIGPEHDGETFTLKVVAEGVQISNGAWEDVWGLNSLPFTPNQPYIP